MSRKKAEQKSKKMNTLLRELKEIKPRYFFFLAVAGIINAIHRSNHVPVPGQNL